MKPWHTEKKCSVCGVPRVEDERHAHCSSCGVVLKKRVVHHPDCDRIRTYLAKHNRTDCQCPICHRLLAAGARCPLHFTDPVVVENSHPKEEA